MSTIKSISRRNFIRITGLFSGGLLLPFVVNAADKKRNLLEKNADSNTFTPNAFLRISPDNSINVILSHVEMGQGVATTLAMLIAEELDCNWNDIKVQHATVAEAYNHTAWGSQMTGGSSTTWSEFDRYRKVGAMARIMLTEAGAKQLGVNVADCQTQNSFVIAGDKKVSYGEVAEAAGKLPIPETAELRPPTQWKYIGKEIVKRIDAPDKVNGKAKFGIDITFPGLLTALVAHAPIVGGKVKSFDATKTKAMAGVRAVVEIPTGVAVIADNFWTAKVGRDALKIEWDLTATKKVDSKEQLLAYKKLATTRGTTIKEAGKIDGNASVAKTMIAEYSVPYLAHASMEPLNCTVQLKDGKCEIWTGTQMPQGDAAAAAAILGIKVSDVAINTPYLGGAFGRRASKNSDFVKEAVQIAKASGKDIKMIWTREDDTRGGYYRPAFLHHIEVGINAAKQPMYWKQTVVGQSVMAKSPMAFLMKDGIDDSSTEGIVESPYINSLPNYLVDLHTPDNDVTTLWWRSVGHSHTGFVMESMIDELAHNAGADPIAFRMTFLKDHPRHLAALKLVSEKSGWGKPLPAGRFRGVAVHESFGSTVAHVAEVSVTNGKVKVHKVTCAVDCGLAVNPDGVRAQMESCIIYGLSAALYGEITLDQGKVNQSNFHDYKVVRMNERPEMNIYIVDSTEKMGGCGEPGLPPLAPAVTNAIFAATGKRVRRLPIRKEDLV